MKKYIALGMLEFKTSIVYRINFMFSVLISPIILALYYFIWKAIYVTDQSILGYTFNDMITYYVVSMLIGHAIFNTVGNKLQQQILYGNLSQNLLKPVSVFAQFLSREFADRSFAFIVEIIPVFLIGIFIFKIAIAQFSAIIFFLVCIIFAFGINFLIGYLMGLLSFWLSRIDSMQWLLFIFVRFASGEFIPLEFLGTTLFKVSKFLPFYYLRYGIIQIYLGRMTLLDIGAFISIQVLWIIILYILIRFVWKLGLKRYGAVGG